MAPWEEFPPVSDGPRSPTDNNAQNSRRGIAQQPCQGLGWRDALPDRACNLGQNDQEDAVKKTARMALVAGLAALALTACGDRDDSSGNAAPDDETTSAAPTEASSSAAATPAGNPDFKACMVSDSGGFDDKGFNQTALKGQTDAGEQFGIQTAQVESTGDEQYADNINQLVQQSCNEITTVGFLLGDATLAAAK